MADCVTTSIINLARGMFLYRVFVLLYNEIISYDAIMKLPLSLTIQMRRNGENGEEFGAGHHGWIGTML